MTSGPALAVHKTEQRRCDAMLAKDLVALDHLLEPDLYFSHATGAVDDKTAYMAKLEAGRITYSAIDWSECQVRGVGEDAALMTGRMLTTVQVDGIPKHLDNRVMSLWTRTDGTWRLSAFQSTPLKP
jgi:ketosteroid isomerase-like protein